jgi:5-methylcytosine-specific restriction enzyme subunit McrC
MPGVCAVREHEEFKLGGPLTKQDLSDLEAIQRESAARVDDHGTANPVFGWKRYGKLTAGSHVGVITTRRGTVVEILPKIDFGDHPDTNHEITKQHFLNMLRRHRSLRKAAQLPESSIRALRRFPMLDVFVRQFLENLNLLVRGGLARRYITAEENLPYLRGRIQFPQQIRANLANRARFFVAYNELSVNRPANRLIHSALAKLGPRVQNSENRQLLRELTAAFADVPQTVNLHSDWREHRVDRSMRHYGPVMQWVGLFLFNRGLTTFAGRHVNLSLLFPMEEVFEDFVTHSFRRYQRQYAVTAQGPRKYLTAINGDHAFRMKPDISLRRGNRVLFILDAKWKRMNGSGIDPKHGIDQADMYQLYAYGKRYGCRTVALVYPQTRDFRVPIRYRYQDEAEGPEGLTLVCLPFDVTAPQASVRESIAELEAMQSSSHPRA